MFGTTTSRCFYQKLFHHGRNCLIRTIKTDKSPCEVNAFWSHLRCISHNISKPSESLPKLSVTPSAGLVDEKVHIRVSGLQPYETVKLSAELEENKVVFQSYAMYIADRNGQIDLYKDAAQSGTYAGVEPMGLFWSMSASQGQRLIKRNVEIPWKVKIRVFPSLEDGPAYLGNTPGTSLLETRVDRSYMKSGVRRIPVKEGPFRGSIFIPEGDGPFPAVIDMFGGLVSLVETRAALLASHGFAAFSLCYMMIDHLPKHLAEIKLQYFLDAFDWYSQQPYVASDRMGMVGLCLGGCLAVWTAAHEPRVKSVVNFNGIPNEGIIQNGKIDPKSNGLRPDLIYVTEEGIVMKECFQLAGNKIIPAWQHGAKILILTAGDDLMTNQEFNFKFMEVLPDKYKRNIEHVHFPGAGHLIEPPYTPHCRAVDPKDKLPSVGLIADKFWDKLMVFGGEPVQHAKAQEFGWIKCLDFLKKSL
ncbi:hypothetical protein CHS0354_036337 [Potamilus streckersoni]|uniref:Uncharacterized protein n=1 Tax=Potamilus streckersoni TaxID=2493646 RepID=A0AAE0SER2_9BIVA|nr:hypothetical protein CHS0354_036337 [Potamilus streckersoni]